VESTPLLPGIDFYLEQAATIIRTDLDDLLPARRYFSLYGKEKGKYKASASLL
jgi:hypothetical protein